MSFCNSNTAKRLKHPVLSRALFRTHSFDGETVTAKAFMRHQRIVWNNVAVLFYWMLHVIFSQLWLLWWKKILFKPFAVITERRVLCLHNQHQSQNDVRIIDSVFLVACFCYFLSAGKHAFRESCETCLPYFRHNVSTYRRRSRVFTRLMIEVAGYFTVKRYKTYHYFIFKTTPTFIAFRGRWEFSTKNY